MIVFVLTDGNSSLVFLVNFFNTRDFVLGLQVPLCLCLVASIPRSVGTQA